MHQRSERRLIHMGGRALQMAARVHRHFTLSGRCNRSICVPACPPLPRQLSQTSKINPATFETPRNYSVCRACRTSMTVARKVIFLECGRYCDTVQARESADGKQQAAPRRAVFMQYHGCAAIASPWLQDGLDGP